MIKGCNKRVLWIRNTENELFDQAYFILSDSAVSGKMSDSDIMREAHKLINDSPVCNYWDEPRATRKYIEKREAARARMGKLVLFSLGFVLGALPAMWLLLS